ncbi:MAG TPA: ubiquinol-cytochrome c reductase iron-sulfur subunit [Gammaproteobacteria bacterium]|nr:ubiquinol-cytochrome c reductase iron-sulfur subunit [Gammaproteobacteria bacterium]
MQNGEVDMHRRRFLTTAATIVGGIGAVATTIPFISTMTPSAKTRAIGAPVEVDIGKLKPGERIIVKWQGKPVWILRRSENTLDHLQELDDELRDPHSEVDQQPPYAENEYRSIKPEYLVVIGLCTHLGCSPNYFPVGESSDLGPDWKGGFFCPCHGSRFDMAGRVFKGVPAPANLVVPPYKFITDNRIRIGDDSEATV